MKLQFRHQTFQKDAAAAVCDVFSGQLFHAATYLVDPGMDFVAEGKQQVLPESRTFTGFNNAPVALADDKVLEHIQALQRSGQIKPSDKLEGRYNLTVEMETGVGKTYTYIKTMYELNKRYGWSKFIVVVPSVAIREGVYKSFQITEEHFAEDYGKKIRYFIYNSAQLTEIDRFASDSAINVMIINSQAFNARGKDARRIYMKLDEFRSRKPIDILAKTNPILIIDEPQSVEGAATKDRLKEFNPLFTLRYSATHRADSVYNMIYRLDALEAYNKKLVKKIAVKGISVSGSTATEGYIYLQGINLSKGNPTATIEFDCKGGSGVRKVSRIVGEGYNLFDNSGELAEYKNGYTILRIDGRDSSIEFTNGKGAIEGCACSEAADNATAMAGFILLMALGIPTGPVLAIVLAALIIQGVIPGPLMFSVYKNLTGTVIAAFFLANIILLILNIPLSGLWVKIARIPYRWLAPFILFLCILGSLVIRNSLFDLWTMMAFGVLGFAARKIDFPIPPFVLGLILGNRLETYFRQTAVLGFSYVFSRPVGLFIMALAVAMIFVFARVKPQLEKPMPESGEPR